ncbi:MAG: prephenate dehydratase [Tissierellia bacterium]|nr:prephenate dehydratase [Tissierellia bacterium]
MSYLEDVREEIDKVDKVLTQQFEKRMELVTEVFKYKIKNNIKILNSTREGEIIRKNTDLLKNKDLEPYLKEFFIKILDLSKSFQNHEINQAKSQIKVSYQGTTGSFSEQALLEYFGDEVNSYPVKKFEDVFKELKEGNANYGVVPIENSSTGAINEVYDLLRKYGLYIVGNTALKINQNLIGLKGSKLEDIREIYSHPQALDQCSEFLKKRDWATIPYHNTAMAAELIKKKNVNYIAAIGSKKAAEFNGLEIIKENINDNNNNYTRFVIIGKTIETKDDNNAISLVFSNPHKPGALYDSLAIFKRNNLNMIRIESRPIIDSPWEYFFYVDLEGDINKDNVKKALSEIESNSNYFKVLGYYKNI